LTKSYHSAVSVLNLNFFTSQDVKSYGAMPLVLDENGRVTLTQEFSDMLTNDFFKAQVLDIIQTAKLRNKEYRATNQLVIGKPYSYTDVCRLLNWEKDERATIGGYTSKFGTTPIFVNLDKAEDAIQYADKLIDRDEFSWHSRKNRTLASSEIKPIIDGSTVNHLLVRRKDADKNSEFLYLGQIQPMAYRDDQLDGAPIVQMDFKLETPIEKNLYDYLTADFS
ncbi:MAG: DUF3427 domain-containing protein, partial [Lactobacillaceae bacterium]|nr:DUF3427 domain-containing protein [Lactobacillaceae bacterium]